MDKHNEITRPCPMCGFETLIEQIDFWDMSNYLYCVECGYSRKMEKKK